MISGATVDKNPAPLFKMAPTMPQVTSGERRLTNVTLPSGEVVRGIRKENSNNNNNNLDNLNKESPKLSMDQLDSVKPLRYSAGLKCDPHLESLRPTRDARHSAFERENKAIRKKIADSDQYEAKHFTGSFADADLQHFRPEPWISPSKEPWVTSRCPAPPLVPSEERLYLAAGNAQSGHYPQDELSCIKMRNRRFLNACGPENNNFSQQAMMANYGNVAMPVFYPFMPFMQPVVMPAQPMSAQPMSAQPMSAQSANILQQEVTSTSPMDELNRLDWMLNEKRRQHPPLTPHYDHEFIRCNVDTSNLEQEMRDLSKTPEPPVRPNVYPLPSSIEDLPKPRPRNVKESSRKENNESVKRLTDVKVADQIAIRSIVLGNSLRSGNASPKSVSSTKASESSKSGSAEI